MFKSATFKLTAWYLLIVMLISLFFSVAVYNVGTNEIASTIRTQSERIYSEFPVFESNPILHPKSDVSNGDHLLLIRLIFFNIIVLLFSGLASYLLAIKTLEPIEEAHEHQKRFTADVSHELRTPLTALKMESEVSLLNPTPTIEDLKQTIVSNLEEVTKLEELINNLLRLSQLEFDEIRQNFNSINLKTIIDDSLQQVDKIAQNKGIKIEATKIQEVLITGDQKSLTQMLVIILDNAIKYSPKDSLISVKTKQTSKSTEIEVIDQGTGISKEDLIHIFDRFYRADQSRTKNEHKEGFGLGLSIAKMISDIHNIELVISSIPGKGTTVRIIFNKD